MNAPPFETADSLVAEGIRHGFFGRAGGVSSAPYDALNTGPGSDDDPAAVNENRRRCAVALGVGPERLLTVHQRHTPKVVVVDGPWGALGPPEADAMVTRASGLAIGALAADCMPVLFLDPGTGVIGAAHAGWRGALGGVLENTVEAMAALGAVRGRILAAIGPCLRPPEFEVGRDLLEAFEAERPGARRFFAPDRRTAKWQLDLTGFAEWRLASVGVEAIEVVGGCTLGEPDRYFSHRHGVRLGLADYGRNLSAIALTRPASDAEC